MKAVKEAPKPGIVYVGTRKNAESLGESMSALGLDVVYYHGGLKAKDRHEIQEEFMSGDADVIVATNAFGMGVDKPDVRFVFHYDIADSLDSYYQEIGRGGRDGKSARAILFYRPEDLRLPKFFAAGGNIDETEIKRIAEAVIEEGAAEPKELEKLTNLSGSKVVRAIQRLEDAGAVEMLPTGEVAPAEEHVDVERASHDAAEAQRAMKEHERLRIEKMRAYAELRSCRRAYLLEYFGEHVSGPCGNCDVCDGTRQAEFERKAAESLEHAPPPERKIAPPVESPLPFPLKTRVAHREWGKGVVESYEGDKITVLFDEQGRKTLSLAAVEQNGLLERAA